jgi:hypothetical protein
MVSKAKNSEIKRHLKNGVKSDMPKGIIPMTFKLSPGPSLTILNLSIVSEGLLFELFVVATFRYKI